MKIYSLFFAAISFISLTGCATRGHLTDQRPINGLEASWAGNASADEFVGAADKLYTAREKAEVLDDIHARISAGQAVDEHYRLLNRIEEARIAHIRECCWENDSASVLIVEIRHAASDPRPFQILTVPPESYTTFSIDYGRYSTYCYYRDHPGSGAGYTITVPQTGSERSAMANREFSAVFTQVRR